MSIRRLLLVALCITSVEAFRKKNTGSQETQRSSKTDSSELDFHAKASTRSNLQAEFQALESSLERKGNPRPAPAPVPRPPPPPPVVEAAVYKPVDKLPKNFCYRLSVGSFKCDDVGSGCKCRYMAPQKCNYWFEAHNRKDMKVETPEGTFVMQKGGCKCDENDQGTREYYCSFGSFGVKDESNQPEARIAANEAEEEEEIVPARIEHAMADRETDTTVSSTCGVYSKYPGVNFKGALEGGSSDLVGCSVSGDIRRNSGAMDKCFAECCSNSQCVGITFHPWGTMLKKDFTGAVDRSGFDTWARK